MWNNEFRLAIDQLFSVLNVAEMTMNEISKDEATLLTADGAFEFLFDELQRINSKLSMELLEQLKIEVTKRRQKKLVSLMKFFQNPESLSEDKSSFFAMSLKKEVFGLAGEIWKKHFENVQPDTTENPSEVQTDRNIVVEEISLQARLGMAVGKRSVQQEHQSASTSTSTDRAIKLACDNYLSTRVMHPFLKHIFDALLLIKPTSIKNEQNFSMSSNFLSKNRKQMVSNTLDSLCMLKSHFCNNQNTQQ